MLIEAQYRSSAQAFKANPFIQAVIPYVMRYAGLRGKLQEQSLQAGVSSSLEEGGTR